MGNLFSSRRTLQLSIVGIVTVVGWAARAKIWRKKAVPSQASNLPPEWQNLVHRNYYGRRRFQIDPNSDRQNMLRDFALISMKDSANYMERVRRLLRYSPSFESNRPKMRNYLARREMPEHLYIAPETVIDMGTYLALKTPHYRNGNILEFVRGKLELFLQIADGLAFLHSLGIVHGNLYPANVLVTDDEDIVLTDAGVHTEVVKLMLLPSGRIPIPQSIVYKSRQELDEEEMPTKSADVYAFASTSYAIMTGREPFSEIANPYQRILKIAQDGHTTLPKPSSTSTVLWNLLMECWSSEPTQRPTMGDVVYRIVRVKSVANRRSLLTE